MVPSPPSPDTIVSSMAKIFGFEKSWLTRDLMTSDKAQARSLSKMGFRQRSFCFDKVHRVFKKDTKLGDTGRHDLRDFGWSLTLEDSQANREALANWMARYLELVERYPYCWVLKYRAHS